MAIEALPELAALLLTAKGLTRLETHPTRLLHIT